MGQQPIPLLIASSLLAFVLPASVWARTPSGMPSMLKANTVVAVSNDSQLRSFVHPVSTQAGSGSCVVIGKREGTYFALTAAHVVSGSSINGGFSVDINGAAYEARKISSFEGKGVDLAIVSFNYPANLPIAIMQPSLKILLDKENTYGMYGYQSVDGSRSVATVAGYSMPSEAVTRPIFRKITVSLQDRINGNKDGFEFAYDAATYPGMSGGGIFAWIMNNPDEKEIMKEIMAGKKFELMPAFPVLIGIHGKSEEYSSGGRSGLSLGIPIDLVSLQLTEKASEIGAPTTLKEALARLDELKDVCWNKSDYVNGQWVCRP